MTKMDLLAVALLLTACPMGLYAQNDAPAAPGYACRAGHACGPSGAARYPAVQIHTG